MAAIHANTWFLPGFGNHDIDAAWRPVTEFREKPVGFRVLCQKPARWAG